MHGAGLGQLYPIIDPHGLLRVLNQQGLDPFPGLAGGRHDVGEIIFPLGVAIIQLMQPAENLRGPEQVDAGVDLPDLAFLGRGVLLLDDPLDAVRRHG